MTWVVQKLKSLIKPSDDGTLVATSLKITLTLMIGLTVAVTSMFVANSYYLDSLRSRIETIAYSLPQNMVTSARNDTTGAQGAKDYDNLRTKLANIKLVNQDAHFVYVMGISSQSKVFFVADAELKDSESFSPRGSEYPEASDALKGMFYNGTSLVEGPVQDRWGNWFSALAPIFDDKTGKIIAVVGFDVPASNYLDIIIVAGVIPILVSLIIASIFLFGDNMRKRRRQALRFKSELVSIASHELRTPLTGIRWGEETIMRQKQDVKTTDIMSSMYESTLRLQESIEDILQLANWQAGRNQELQIAPIDIHAIFAGIFAIQKLPAAQRGISIEFSNDWPEDLIISCDMQRMKRVFNNLVSNSIKYARPHTTVTVGYENVEGDHVISITDIGIGIPASEQTRVFEGFYRASNAIKHEAGGTGMGLYLSRSVVEQHGGKLWLSSVEDKGTTSFVRLP